MSARPLLPSTPLDWMRRASSLPSVSVWRPPASLAMRARYVFLALALFNAIGVVPIGLANTHGTPLLRAATLAGALVLAGAWIMAYRAGRHRGASVVVETVAMLGACVGVGTPHAALGVVYSSTFLTALYPDLRAARASGLGNTGAFLLALWLTRHPGVPPLLSPAAILPAVQVLVMGGLVYSMGRMIERTERERVRAGVLANLGEALVAAREPRQIFAAGADAAVALGAQGHVKSATFFVVTAESWEVVATRGAASVTPGKRFAAADLPADLVAAHESFGELAGAKAAAAAALLAEDGQASHGVVIRGEGSADGQPALVLVVLTSTLLAEETRVHLGVALHQVSLAIELQRSQESLVRAERLAAIGSLAATVGHELRNPLATIQGAATFLRRKVGGSSPDPRVSEFFGIIDREVVASNRIITELLDFARTRPLILAPTVLHALVEETRQLVPLERVRLTNAIPDELAPQLLDRDQIRQVLANLIQNAAEAVQDEPEAEVTVRAKIDARAALVLDVEDNGPGMSKEIATRAFEPLFTTKTRGTGLGLALVAKVVGAHGGTLRIEEREPRGTRVIVEIPARTADSRDAPSTAVSV